MIKRLFLLICFLSGLCLTARANQEYIVNLEKGDNGKQTVVLPYARVTFEFVTMYANMARVRLTVENMTPDEAILLFKYSQDERTLKKHKPKFEFEKTYPGAKGSRRVTGCKEILNYFEPIVPAETVPLFTIDVSTTETVRLSLPFYRAKFKPKDLNNSGKKNIKYRILAEDIIVFDINVKAWTENDSTYLKTKQIVNEFIDSLQKVSFCPNKRHIPSLAQQQKPYLEKKDSLIGVISEIIRNPDWMPTDPPYQAYSALIQSLREINLDDYNKDCGRDKSVDRGHSCNLCSLTAQQVYHQLDDIYQQLRAGKITGDAAEKKAKALYNCYQKSKKRKKDSFYTEKISRFYNRIVM